MCFYKILSGLDVYIYIWVYTNLPFFSWPSLLFQSALDLVRLSPLFVRRGPALVCCVHFHPTEPGDPPLTRSTAPHVTPHSVGVSVTECGWVRDGAMSPAYIILSLRNASSDFADALKYSMALCSKWNPSIIVELATGIIGVFIHLCPL